MDSAGLLDLLGNENRRRILRLLSQKPCYVTEISDYLAVSPKAVIDHLRKLEDAGLVESRTDENRRKYFNIARNLRLEVSVTPYGFGTKSAYPASSSFDMTSCRHLSLEIRAPEATDDIADLAAEYQRLDELENELSLAQRWAQGRLTDVLDRLAEEIAVDGNCRLYAEVLSILADDVADVPTLAERVDAPVPLIEDALATLSDHGLVYRVEGGWTLA